MTTVMLPTHDATRLAEALRKHGLPGQRSKTAITRLRRERARRTTSTRRPELCQRLNDWLVETYSREIGRRGGEVSIRTDRDREEWLAVADRKDRLTLLRLSTWRYYSRQHGKRRASLAYLCGREDGQRWAVRVPGTITTVSEALTWITPAAVREAEHAGRRAQRQGDVYAVETVRLHDGTGDLPEHHTWDATRRLLSHPQHSELHLPYPVRFIPQNAYGMGRGAGRGYGD